jgi:Spy/CpxP family protein refolding chaperone
MKRAHLTVLACFAATLVPSVALPQMLPIPPGKWWERPRVAEELALTAEQQEKLESMTVDQARSLVDLKAAVEKAEIDLRVAADGEPLNPEKIRAAFSALQQARMRMEAERFEMLIRVRQTLTTPQWMRLKELTREWAERAGKEGELRDRVGPRPMRARP